MNADLFGVCRIWTHLRYSVAPKVWSPVPKEQARQALDIMLPTTRAANRYSDREDRRDQTSISLKRVAVGFAGADPQRVIDRCDEDLAVADLAGARAGGNDRNRLVGETRRDGDFDAQLRQEIHDIFGAAVHFGVALLAAVTLDLGHGHAGHPDGGQGLANLVQLEWFDNGNNELHGQAFISKDSEKWVAP